MAVMSLTELRDYNNWIGKTPDEVREAVKALVLGWESVFPTSKPHLPLWAHRVRNCFNGTPPAVLTRWGEVAAKEYTKRIMDKLNVNWKYQEHYALSGVVYHDESGRVWLQTSAISALYHIPDGLIVRGYAKAKDAIWGQNSIPVFKLVSLDGTNGSRECIIKSIKLFSEGPDLYDPILTQPHTTVYVLRRLVTDIRYRGSYNYSETVIQGLVAHEYHDVDPHNRAAWGYLEGPGWLKGGAFPKHDHFGLEMATQH
jgi:hypothetical protein